MKKYIIALIVISLLSGSVVYAALTLEEQANKYFNRTCNKRWVTGYRAALCYLKEQVENIEPGHEGPQGPPGEKGDKGDQGEQGEPGTPSWDEQRISSIEARLNILENQGELSFFDDFNDGDADGWISIAGYPPGTHGNWRVEDGVVIEDMGRDHFIFALENYPLSDQIVEAKVLWHDNGYAGITIWCQDENNSVQVFYRYQSSVVVMEKIDGYEFMTLYPNDKWERVWRTMKVEANSKKGEIAVYLDDDYLFTHTVTTTKRTGLSGFNSGNAGGSFDDFRLTSN